MKKSLVLCIVILLMGGSYLSAQNSLSNGKALNFPAKKYGISIGNSYEFTGIRINFADENVKKVNGLNVTFWLKKFKNQNAIVNGISVGVIPLAGTMRPISLGLLGCGGANKLNGLWLIPTPTDASWMNRIEAQFGVVHYFVLKNSYPSDHEDLKQRIQQHLKWRNRNHNDSLLRQIQNRTYVI